MSNCAEIENQLKSCLKTISDSRPTDPEEKDEKKGHRRRRNFYITSLSFFSVLLIILIFWYIITPVLRLMSGTYKLWADQAFGGEMIVHDVTDSNKKGSDSFIIYTTNSPDSGEVRIITMFIVLFFIFFTAILYVSAEALKREDQYYKTITKEFDPEDPYTKKTCLESKSLLEILATLLWGVLGFGLISIVVFFLVFIDQYNPYGWLFYWCTYIILGLIIIPIFLLVRFNRIVNFARFDNKYKCDKYFPEEPEDNST